MLSESELFRVRVAMIQSVLRNESLGAVLITRPDNYAMATGGKRNYVNIATDAGAKVCTRSNCYRCPQFIPPLLV